MECIGDVEFFEEKSTEMRHIYFMHSFLGGVFYERYITRGFKYLFCCWWLLSYLSLAVLPTALLIGHQRLDFQTTKHCIGWIIYVHLWIIIMLKVYSKRNTFNALFDHINGTLNEPNLLSSPTEEEIQQLSIENFVWKVGKYFTVCSFTLYFSKLLLKFVTTLETSEFYVDYQKDFIVPVLPIGSQTFTSYFAFFNLLFVSYFLLAISVWVSVALPAVLSVYLKNQTIRLLNDMKYHSDVAVECLEECIRREEKILTRSMGEENVARFLLREIARRRERDTEEFMIKVQQWIKIHQKLIRFTNLYKESTSDLLTILVTSMLLAIVFTGYQTLKGTLDLQYGGFVSSLCLSISTILLLILCHTGNAIREMSDSLSAAIYSMPWYYLPANHQKVLLIFLCLTQKSQEMKIYNIMPLSLERLPAMLNSAYSYVQYTRLFEIRSK